MRIAENEQGIVCIDGRPVADHYREHGTIVARVYVLTKRYDGSGPYACILGMMALKALGSFEAVQIALSDKCTTIARKVADAAHMSFKQTSALEAGWCGFEMTGEDPDFYLLGSKAFAQCRNARDIPNVYDGNPE